MCDTFLATVYKIKTILNKIFSFNSEHFRTKFFYKQNKKNLNGITYKGKWKKRPTENWTISHQITY